MKKEIRLYNIIFPVWMLILIPVLWIALLPLNFIVDSIILLIALKFVIKTTDIKSIYKKTIFKIWTFGFLSDIVGAFILLYASQMPFRNTDNDYVYKLDALNWNAFNNPYAFTYMLLAVIISGVLIYIFNYKISFNEAGLDKLDKIKVSLFLAILTAPYTFFIPAEWIN